MSYEKLNVEPIMVEYVLNEDMDDFIASFMWDDKRYYLSDFIRTHNNPWSGEMDVPDYIHGYEANNYWNPLFVELINGEYVDHINLYKVVE